MYHLQSPSDQAFIGAIAPPVSPFQSMVAAIDLAATAPLAKRHRAVAGALKPFLGLPDLLCHMSCPCSPDRYVRHLLHAGADYTVLALIWRPGQMSPVHGHLSWCALGIHRGCMTETLFDPGPTEPEPRSCFQRRAGTISHSPGDPNAIHRLANLGTQTATSIHVYGARYDRLGEQVNRVWAA